jgi:hypothetical protein
MIKAPPPNKFTIFPSDLEVRGQAGASRFTTLSLLAMEEMDE